MQCNTLTSFYTGNSASAPGQRSWGRQPWHSPTRGNVASRGQAVSWPCIFSSAANTSQHIPNKIRQVSAHRARQHSLGMPRWSFFPDKALFSFPFPILWEQILTLVLKSPLPFYKSTSTRVT